MRFRKIIGLASVSALLVGMCGVSGAYADTSTTEIGRVTYSVDTESPEAGATVTKCRWSVEKNLVIPENVLIDDISYPVTAIGPNGLSGCSLKTVTLPDTVHTLGEAAFYNNTSLTSVQLSAAITNIPVEAFKRTNLGDFTIPSTVTSIADNAFESAGLTNVVIPDSVTQMGTSVFKNNRRLANVQLGAGLSTIPAGTFINSSLTEVSFPANIRSIGGAAFASSTLQRVVIPETIESIGEQAFQANYITSLELPAGMTEIAAGVFKNNRLESVNIPETVTTIGSEAFASNRLTTLQIPVGMTEIAANAFQSNSLTTLSLPDGITAIREAAFEYNRLTELTIPSAVTVIEKRAFGSNDLGTVRFTGPAPTVAAGDQFTGFVAAFGRYDDVTLEYPKSREGQEAGRYHNGMYGRYKMKPYEDRAQLTVSAVENVQGLDPQDSGVTFNLRVVSPDQSEAAAPVENQMMAPGVYKLVAGYQADSDTFGEDTRNVVSHGWTCVVNGVESVISANTEGSLTLNTGDVVNCSHRFTVSYTRPAMELIPAKPTKPEEPESPENPGQPDNLGQPETPGQPDNSGTPNPPEQPESPGNPSDSGQPEQPAQPGAPEDSAKPAIVVPPVSVMQVAVNEDTAVKTPVNEAKMAMVSEDKITTKSLPNTGFPQQLTISIFTMFLAGAGLLGWKRSQTTCK